MVFKGKHIILGVTGSIAGYKAISLLRTLIQEGAEVTVVMTEAATRFVAPLTFEVLSQKQVLTNLFTPSDSMPHLTLPERADLLVIAPATANILAKCALGLADDLLSTMVLTAKCPLVAVPAMDGGMWHHPTVVDHVRILRERGMKVLDPEDGPLASGHVGVGRFPAENMIVDALRARLIARRDWEGHRVLVSAGPTREPIDEVRFLSNPSTGKMGYAMARAALDRGAEVVLVSGPTALSDPPGIEVICVKTAEEMHQALAEKLPWTTVLIMAAAVGDWQPRHPASGKLKKLKWKGNSLELKPTVDILEALSRQRTHQIMVGFAAETENLVENGTEKLKRKQLDLLVANIVGGANSAFGNDENAVMILKHGEPPVPLERMPKRQLADCILDHVLSCQPKGNVLADHPSQRVG